MALKAAIIGVHVALALGGSVAAASVAHADRQAFHDYLQSHGVQPAPTSQWKHFDAAAQFMCSELRDGKSASYVVGQYTGGFDSQYVNRYDGGFIRPYADTVVAGAQQEVCPDTIR